MYHLQQSPGRTVLIHGKEYLFFSGYSYLGMGQLPEFIELIQTGIQKFGFLYPSSRISNTQLQLYAVFENYLAELTCTEETVTFSSGYLAGRAIVDLLAKNAKNCFVAPDTHPALQIGVPPLQKHWKKEMVQAVNELNDNYFTLLADLVNPIKAKVLDFSFLNDLLPYKRVTCIIDNSHGIGYLGPNGEGISHFLPKLTNVDFILTYSLSKALHINGGAVSCSSHTAALLRTSPYFTGSTPIAPCSVYAFIRGRELYELQRKKLFRNIKTFIEYLRDVPGIINHPALPIFLLKKELDHVVFHPHKIIISSFPYPDPSGGRINRIVLNALHTENDLSRTASLLHDLMA